MRLNEQLDIRQERVMRKLDSDVPATVSKPLSAMRATLHDGVVRDRVAALQAELQEARASASESCEEVKKLKKQLNSIEREKGEWEKRRDVDSEANRQVTQELRDAKAEIERVNNVVKKLDSEVRIKNYRLGKSGEENELLKKRIQELCGRDIDRGVRAELTGAKDALVKEQKLTKELVTLTERLVEMVKRLQAFSALVARIKELDLTESQFAEFVSRVD